MSVACFTARRLASLRLLAISIAALSLTAGTSRAAFPPTTIGGSNLASSIQATVDGFRTALGDPNNANNPGPLTGRREINWDGGGAVVGASSVSPLTAFTNTRGATMTTPGTAFLQTPVNDALLTGIQANYATAFAAFSAIRIFTPVGSNITDVTFSLPGSNGATQATVGGFGAVFSDVDVANTTKIEFFSLTNALINSLFVPPGNPATTAPGPRFSFAGAIANAGERIARVRITTGNQSLGLNDNNGDPVELAVMDDFLYSEPAAVPEPATASLTLAALLAAATLRNRRRAAA